MLAGVAGGSTPTGTGFGCSLSNRGENVFTYAMTASRESAFRNFAQAGIAVPGSPLEMVRLRSSSVGRLPDSVVRYSNIPSVKSRGRGLRIIAYGPSPLPSFPWQGAQRDS